MAISLTGFLRFWKPNRPENRPKYLEEINALSSATSALSIPEDEKSNSLETPLPDNARIRKWRLKRKDPLVKAIS